MENVHNTTGQPEGTGPGNTNGWMPPEHNNPKEGNHGGKKFFDSIRQSGFFRSETRWIGGVAGGLARRLNIDPIIVRAGLVVLALFSGLGLLLYAAAWALLPEERDGRIHMEEAIRGNFNGALIGAGIFAILGLGALNSLFFFGKNIPWEFTVLFWIGLTIASIYIISQVKDGELRAQSTPQHKPTYQQPQPHNTPNAPYTSAAQTSHTDDSVHQRSDETTPLPTVHTPNSDTSSHSLHDEPAAQTPPQPQPQQWTTYGHYPQQPPAPPQNPPTTNAWDWTPPKKVDDSPGATQFAVLAGLLLLIASGLFFARERGAFDSDLSLYAILIASTLTLSGITVIINGFRGKTSGGAGTLATTALVFGVIAGSIALPGIKIGEGNFSGISDAKYVPTSVETLTEGTSFGIGDITLDLTELDRAELRSYSSTPINIPLSGGIGELRIIVPADIPTTADTAVAVGSVSDTHGSQGGIGRSTITYENELVANGAEPILHLDLSVGVGEISIKEK